jgi:hypothetical protein
LSAHKQHFGFHARTKALRCDVCSDYKDRLLIGNGVRHQCLAYDPAGGGLRSALRFENIHVKPTYPRKKKHTAGRYARHRTSKILSPAAKSLRWLVLDSARLRKCSINYSSHISFFLLDFVIDRIVPAVYRVAVVVKHPIQLVVHRLRGFPCNGCHDFWTDRDTTDF